MGAGRVCPRRSARPEGERIGEIWFEPPPELPELLVKYLFTSESLSVQVHPSGCPGACGQPRQGGVLAGAHGRAGREAGGGLQEQVSPEQMRAAALDGSIEQLLEWHAVKPGDFIYLTAGTVHAIGAGLSLIEVQQNSDITYRLYDYGRPRELHLDDGIAVADGAPHDPALRRHVPERGDVRLVDGPHFRLDRLDGAAGRGDRARYGDGPLLVIPVDGPVTLGGRRWRRGDAAWRTISSAIAFGDYRALDRAAA